jgi:prepilin-type N-terminal cleavage/methylation domain-containing protein
VRGIAGPRKSGRGDGGLSLIELIVAVAVIAALVGLLAPQAQLRWAAEALRCVRNIDGMMAKARVLAMSREGRVVLMIEKREDGGYYGAILIADRDGNISAGPGEMPGGGERLGSFVTLSYRDDAGGAWTAIDAEAAEGDGALDTDGTLTLSFRRATGGLGSWNNDSEDLDTKAPAVSVDGRYFITIQPLTGSHRVTAEIP